MPLAAAAAFAPLRYGAFRALWIANLTSNIGLWIQNTGAGWLMTSLDPSPVMVALVQAAAMLPVFLFALPGGAVADILDRRVTLIAAQLWLTASGLLLAALTAVDLLGPWGLLVLSFAIGASTAVKFPAWAATTPELVPREDLMQAIALNGVGFNLARAVGPALGGFVVAAAGVATAFALNAAAFLALLGALVAWRRPVSPRPAELPPERLVTAMRVGLGFVAAMPTMRAAILRACTFFFFASSVWALLPLIVREGLGMGPAVFGLMLAVAGAGAITAGVAMPAVRGRLTHGALVFWASLLASAAMAMLAFATHWALAAVALLLYGAAWLAAGSTLQVAAQTATPPWVRARALGVYQLSFFGAQAFGAVLWGWVATRAGLPIALGLCAVLGAASAAVARPWRLTRTAQAGGPQEQSFSAIPLPRPKSPAAELAALLHEGSGRVLEAVRYRVDPADRDAFLAAMREVRQVRLRAGALVWRLYEDVAQPDRWTELWAMESWTEHLREAMRLDETDRAALARAAALHRGEGPPEAGRHLNVDP
jgi:MFS family permease